MTKINQTSERITRISMMIPATLEASRDIKNIRFDGPKDIKSSPFSKILFNGPPPATVTNSVFAFMT